MSTRKSLLATAVAAAVAAPAAQAYDIDVGEDSSLALEGTLEPAYVSTTDSNGDSASQLEDNDSTLQLEGEHVFDGNVRGFFHLEYEYDSNEATGGINATDSAWVGLEGDFGLARTGTYDTLLENNMHELIDPFEYASVSEEADSGEGDQVTYLSPGFGSGFSFGVEARHQGDAEGVIGEDIPSGDAGSGGTGLAAVARFDTSNWGLSIGADTRGAVPVDTNGNGTTDSYNDESTRAIGGYFNLGDLRIAGRYASEANVGNDNDVEYTGAGINYGYGAGDLYAVVQDVSPDQGTSRTETSLGVMHGLYENLSLFAEIGRFDRQNDAGDVTAVGAIYEF